MRKASFTVAFIVAVSVFQLGITVVPEMVNAITLYVGGPGPGNFTSIQDAINASVDGDKVFVYSGTYNETITIDKSITIEGEFMSLTRINGGSVGDVVTVNADWVNISFFTIVGSGSGIQNAGLNLTSVQNCTLSYLRIQDNEQGIVLSYSHGNRITDVDASFNRRGGISLFNSNYTVIHSSTFRENDYGVYMWSSQNNTLTDNNVLMSAGNGIDLRYSNWNILTGNQAVNNDFGIRIESSDNNSLTANRVSGSSPRGVHLSNSHNNAFNNNILSNFIDFFLLVSSRNSFVNNLVSATATAFSLDYSDHNTFLSNRGGRYDVKRSRGNLILNGTEVFEISLWSADNNTVQNTLFRNNSQGMDLSLAPSNFISHNRITSSSSYGIRMSRSDLNVIVNNTFIDLVYGMDIYDSDSNIITGNTISNSRGFGIGLERSEANTLVRNVMTGDGLYLYGISPEHWNTHNIDTSNTINGLPIYYWKDVTGGTVPADAGQVILGGCMNVTVKDLDLSDAYVGVEAGFSAGLVINNVSTSNMYDGIAFYSTNASVVSNNTASSSRDNGFVFEIANSNFIYNNSAISSGFHGFLIEDSEFSIIANNTSTLSAWRGMMILSSNQNVFRGNRINANIMEGFHLRDSRFNTFANNTANRNRKAGLILTSSLFNLIRDNSFSGNFGVMFFSHGIDLGQFSSNNIITGNYVSSNGYYGIYITSDSNTVARNNVRGNLNAGVIILFGADNAVYENNVSGNGVGIHLLSGFNNKVYHNNIIGNTFQANDSTDTNEWDDGYPSGGNYWSNYTGTDWFSGPNQSLPGSDGIGDNPLIIDADSQDRYPLMTPWGIYFPLPPVIHQAELTGGNLENVTLRWHLSPDDGSGGKTVAAYQVYRSTSYDPQGSGYQLMAVLPNGTSEYTDASIGVGDPNNYFFMICAIDAINRTECAGDQAGKYARSLNVGRNLVSIPLLPSDANITSVLQTVLFNRAEYYDSVAGEWRTYTLLKPYGPGFTTIDTGFGFWVNVTNSTNLTVAGIVDWSTEVLLKTGWNLVGFPSFGVGYTVADLKAEIGAIDVETSDSSSPPYFLRTMSDAEILQAGRGYWVWVDSDVVWTVTSS